MIRAYCLPLALGMSFFCHAAPSPKDVSFSLYGVPVSVLARVVVDDVNGLSVVMSHEVAEDQTPVNFSIKRFSPEQAMGALREVLAARGYRLRVSGGIYFLEKAPQEDPGVLVYLPKYRSVSYLAELVTGLLPRSAILSQRAVGSSQVQQSQQQRQHQAGVAQISDTPSDSGTSAYSLIDKAEKDALVIKASERELVMVKKLLSEVDRPVAEMLVKAVLMEVQTSKNDVSAVNFLASIISSKLGISASARHSGGASADSGVTFKIGGLEAVWSAINSDNRFKVVSAPQIRVKSGSSARFSVGADTPVLGAVNYQGNGQSVQSVEYKPSGVILELRPEIRGELAELKVFQQLSSFAETRTGVNGTPTLLKRELTTSVVVGQNDVVLLGGLDEEKTTDTSSGFSFLPAWLRSSGSEGSKAQIVLMLYVERVQTPGESF